ncbi:MAG TPA: hypothetical protein VGZ32_07740 [Actinocrinis sp.]|uniref:hypothetical protein n=1 Tax=Actinocrinis sp. TaxID=1920516 RepID=UPI002DDD333D|nr:hypothetical protein [Actinocrinis sp.]HEV3170214.1 hypothetical protein [Actinocrinis sp.]
MSSEPEPNPHPRRESRRAPPDASAPTGHVHAPSQNIEALPQNTEAQPERFGKGRPVALRELAGAGLIVRTAADPVGRPALAADVYALAWPIVFAQLTRRIELGRGHPVCARSVRSLSADCLDRFQDDVAAVVDYVLRHAHAPIHNLEAWIASRLTAATVDGHRRERGRRGAAQRPRVPKWLGTALGDDPWLTELALAVLDWVGVPVAAGSGLWPVDVWAQRRAAALGDWSCGNPAAVERDIETVLAAMRTRPDWHLKYVERPLGHKRAPVYAGTQSPDDQADQGSVLCFVTAREHDESRLDQLAALAVDELERRLADGEDPRACVADVMRRVFAEAGPAWGLDRPPHDGPGHEERVSALLADPAALDRIVAEVLDIVGVAALR